MKKIIGRGVLACAAGLGLIGLGFPGFSAPAAADVETPETAVRNWPVRPRAEALALIAKYGEPSRFSDDELLWFNRGSWRRTAVFRSAPQGFLHGRNILEQSILREVPAGKLAQLKRFDRSLRFDKKSGELISYAESENLNYLALNLAEEIVAGKRTPEAARVIYRKTIRLSESGKSSPYLDGFIFPTPQAKPSTPKPAAPPYDGEIESLDPPPPSGGSR